MIIACINVIRSVKQDCKCEACHDHYNRACSSIFNGRGKGCTRDVSAQ